ncbi:MAG: hypothetical protein HY721_20365 [Planctomycetes bacterium]|nr:hypothetical protein [Planctomycetota bacterium]
MVLKRLRVLGFSALYVALQLALIVSAGFREDKRFGFQMFAESTRYQAVLFRDLRDGRLEPAPGGRWLVRGEGGAAAFYSWDRFVQDFRLDRLEERKRAKTGIGVTLKYLEEALRYVACHIPLDRETRRLILKVEHRRAGGKTETVTLESPRRELEGSAEESHK